MNLIIGLTAAYCGIINICNPKQVSDSTFKTSKNNIRIDIPLSLLFSLIFTVFILNSINFTIPNRAGEKLLFIVSSLKISNFYYYFYAILYSISSTLIFISIIALDNILINKNQNVKYSKLGNVLLIIFGIIIALL